MRRPAIPPAAALLAALVLAVPGLAGCRITTGSPPSPQDSPALAVVRQAERDGRFDVALDGPMPTRAQVGLASGEDLVQLEPDDRGDTIAVTATLTGGGRFEVSGSSVTVETTYMDVTTPRSPVAVDDSLMPPKSIGVTQLVSSTAEARDAILERAEVLGLDADDIERWAATAPTGPGTTRNSVQGFAGAAPIGYVTAGVTVYTDSSSEYLIWALTWTPPIPGYAYDSSGRPRPTSS